jgi:FkbM family methyltransferase
MIEERDEEDAELVEFVRSLIIRPKANRKLNLANKKVTDQSQIGQSKYMDTALGSKRDGFFIEAGAWDGEGLSNTLFFELERNWTGLLIEPTPSLFKQILAKNRNVFAINACIANKRPIVSKFRLFHWYSGRDSSFNEADRERIDKNSRKVAYVPCFSLATIMRAIGVSHVDYFSLDVEGGEMDVLKGINFAKIEIESFTIEHNNDRKNKEAINSFMLENGYKILKEDYLDNYFIKN